MFQHATRREKKIILLARPPLRMVQGREKSSQGEIWQHPQALSKRAEGASKRRPGSKDLENLICAYMYFTESMFLKCQQHLAGTEKRAQITSGRQRQASSKRRTKMSDAGTNQKALLSSGTIWGGEARFRAWTLKTGPQLYTDIHICVSIC